MMGSRLRTFLLLGILPVAATLGGLLRNPEPVPLILGAYAVLLAAALAFFFHSPAEMRRWIRTAEERERDLIRRQEELQSRVDLLSAEREISLVLNEDVDFRIVLDRVLTLACDTFGGDVELWMRDGDRIVPRAARTGGKTRFEFPDREDRCIRNCFREGRLLFEAEEGCLRVLAPLQADRDIIGVVRLTVPREAEAALAERRARALSMQMAEFSKFLALAVKTPDLYTRAVQDALTGLWTKRHFFSQVPLAIETARRYGEPLSLIMVDVDHFKKVNDTYGHPVGDKVLQAVAAILKRRVRGGAVFRYGGEEMAVLLPKTGLSGGVAVAERLRRAIEARRIAGIRVTASFGVAELDGTIADAETFVERADRALYRAKEEGRNRVVAADPASPQSVPTRRLQRSA